MIAKFGALFLTEEDPASLGTWRICLRTGEVERKTTTAVNVSAFPVRTGTSKYLISWPRLANCRPLKISRCQLFRREKVSNCFRQESFSFIFVLTKKGRKTKKRKKEEEIEKRDCGPPTWKVFFCDFVGLEPSGTLSPRRRESNALAGYTTGYRI